MTTIVMFDHTVSIRYLSSARTKLTSAEYTPVIEHFEVEAKYREAFDQLKYSLLDKISNPATLETLSTKFYQCFVETLDQCIANAQSMPYTNRSNKKNDIIRSQTTQSIRKPRGIMPRPDSGVVMDDGSEESGSVMLGHRDSVRTVRTALRGSQVPETVNEVVPATGFEGLMMGMDGADVQAWNNGVMYPQMMPEQLIPTGGMTPQTEFVNWGQIYPGFDTLGNGVNGFTGFNGQQ